MIEPLTPPDLDLRSFTYMPLEVVRLRDSDIVVLASGEEFRAAVLLWCAAWHQVPAASLPKDDRMLANLAGFGRDLKGWRSVSEAALRGFVECSDGRLYHPVIAEKAIESGSKKRKQVSQTAAATEARRAAKEKRDKERNDQRNDVVDDDRSARETERNEVQGIGEEQNRIEKKGESNSPSKNNLVLVEGGDGPTAIDESYEPSDRAVEYAYSLGMKKADLALELSKFIALSMGSRAVSYNPDMNFKVFCDRWLEFKRKKDPNWKPEPDAAPAAPVVDKSDWAIVIEGTLEHTCWNIINREKGLRPLFLCKQIRKDGTIVERAAKCPTLFPAEFNDFGERIAPPENEENAA